ncbi:hypothetical protein [Aurantibacillus circumpalustris]|uniref:hypothetical protein n=1 Tax=Aurantibacillus circumpalustris TaxID=3036359 RepID=UPI00295AA0FF|nr:hypothetical protein [Aurantibacillus circumpalustris]
MRIREAITFLDYDLNHLSDDDLHRLIKKHAKVFEMVNNKEVELIVLKQLAEILTEEN